STRWRCSISVAICHLTDSAYIPVPASNRTRSRAKSGEGAQFSEGKKKREALLSGPGRDGSVAWELSGVEPWATAAMTRALSVGGASVRGSPYGSNPATARYCLSAAWQVAHPVRRDRKSAVEGKSGAQGGCRV